MVSDLKGRWRIRNARPHVLSAFVLAVLASAGFALSQRFGQRGMPKHSEIPLTPGEKAVLLQGKHESKDEGDLCETAVEFQVGGRSKPSTLSLDIANTGTERVDDLWIVGPNQVNFHDVRSILRSLNLDGLSEREKALALWDFIRKQCYHHYSAETGMDVHHPTKFFCVYGYGLCDDFAENFQVLANHAGLALRMVGLGNTRGREILGHMTSEVFYDGAWHLLDANMGAFFPKEGGGEASAQEIRESVLRNPDHNLVRRTFAGFRRELIADNLLYYAGHPPSYSIQGCIAKYHTMSFSLRPGERIRLAFAEGTEFHGRYPDKTYDKRRPPIFSNGESVYCPDLKGKTALSGPAISHNIAFFGEDGIQPSVHLRHPGEGHFVYRVRVPYVILNASVRMEIVNEARGGRVRVWAYDRWGQGTRPHTWRLLHESTAKGRHVEDLDMSGILWQEPSGPNKTPKGAQYEYLIKVELSGEDQTVGVEALEFRTSFQTASRSLPSLEKGCNALRLIHPRRHSPLVLSQQCQERSDGLTELALWSRDVRLVYVCRQNHNEAPTFDEQAVLPKDGEAVPEGDVALHWHASDGDGIKLYHVEVSDRLDFRYPVCPALEVDTTESSLRIKAGYLRRNLRYFWRVSAMDGQGNWSSPVVHNFMYAPS